MGPLLVSTSTAQYMQYPRGKTLSSFSGLQNCLWSDRHERTRSFNNLYIGNVSSWKLSIKKYVSYIFYILNIHNCFVSRILAKQTIVLKLNKYFLISSNEQVLSFAPTRQRGGNGKMVNSPLFSIHHESTKTPMNNTRTYCPLRGLISCSCEGLRPPADAFFALWAKKELLMQFLIILGHFWFQQ